MLPQALKPSSLRHHTYVYFSLIVDNRALSHCIQFEVFYVSEAVFQTKKGNC